jgi:long-subunit fatty acid transport protein
MVAAVAVVVLSTVCNQNEPVRPHKIIVEKIVAKKKAMKRPLSQRMQGIITLLMLSMLVFMATDADAQDQPLERIEIPSSMNPVGSGARALGMGGAFIAIADDATAASWNPGGLVQLEKPEVSEVVANFQRKESSAFGTDETSWDQTVTDNNLNYLSAVYPFSWLGRNMVISASYQYLYDFKRNLDLPRSFSDSQWMYEGDEKFRHDGGFSALGFAYSAQLTPKLSVGLTLNFWQDELFTNKIKLKQTQSGRGYLNEDYFTLDAEWSDTYSYEGFNVNLGFLWNTTRRLTIGAVLKSPFTMDLKHKSNQHRTLIFPGNPSKDIIYSADNETNEDLDMPVSYGIGLAFRFSDSLTVSADIYRTEWDGYKLKTTAGEEISPVTGDPADESDIEPTIQFRAGMEYLYIGDKYVIPIRGGIFSDPAPAKGKTDNFYGISFGSGIALNKIIFDMAYQYRFGNKVNQFILEEFDFSQDVTEHTVYASIIYHY